MYRLVLYTLLAFLLVAGIESAFGLLTFSPIHLAWSVALITTITLLFNKIFSHLFSAPSNPESTYITALILALIISPPTTFFNPLFLSLIFWASAWAVVSKYIFAIRDKHIFNPAALGVAVTALILGQSASWWIGSWALLPFVLAGGVLITRKVKHFDLVLAFLVTSTIVIFVPALLHGVGIANGLSRAFVLVPTIFFATVMLTEPLTTPPTRVLRILYGVFVGALFFQNANVFGVYSTPALALLIGNLFSYIISPKTKLILTLIDRIRISPNVFEFVFTPNRKFSFRPGQYLEWTLAHSSADSRGIRRYFTIVSAPNDDALRLGVKFYKPASTFKHTLLSLRRGNTLVASQLSGDFTLPHNKTRKLVFIAGGIGITPFVSMIRDLIGQGEKRDMVLLYANRTSADISYRSLLERAEKNGVRTVHVLSDEPKSQNNFSKIDLNTIRMNVPDFAERIFYISGPHGMVSGISTLLRTLGIPSAHIKTDYFPGFA